MALNATSALSPRDNFTKREFERYLRSLGATRSQALKAMHALPPGTMRAMLPLWRRVRIAWKGRHG